MKYKSNSRLFAVIISCAIVLAGFYLSALNAYAATNTDGNWTTGQTIDLIPDLTGEPLLNQGWGLWDANQVNANGWDSGEYGYAIHAQDTEDDLGTKSYTGGVYYTIELSEADKVKADLGQLTLGASSVNWFQASSRHYISIRVYFYDSNGEAIGSGVTKTYDNYYVAQKDVTLTLTDAAVPAGTCSIKVWFSNWGTLSGRPYIANPACYLYDTTAPSFSGATLEKTSVADSANNRAVTGDTVKYCIGFNEKISITSGGTAAVTLNGSAYLTSGNAQVVTENGKSRVCYTFTLPEGSQSGTIALSSVSGLTVKDEAGNSYTYNGSPSAETLQYYKTMSVSSSLISLSFSGGSTATYNTDYTASLVAQTGYSLPSAIKVTVGGATLTPGTGYMYDSSTGALTVKGSVITGNIVVTASGVAKTYTVSLDMQGGSMGSASVVVTYDSAMPSITLPVRTGYTFGGYFTQTDGNGTQYYGADGSSLRSFDQTSGITLYALWTANTYTVVYNANKPSGASGTVMGSTVSSSHTYDTQKALPANGYSLKGWTFRGWATSPSGGVVYANGAQVKNITAEDGGTVNLYAVWEQTAHQITFNASGGSGSGTVSVLYDGALPALITEPSRNGYNFAGYFTEPDGNGQQYYTADGEAVNGMTYTACEDIKLYAFWKPISYSIELYNEGTYVGTIDNVIFGTLLLPSAETLGLEKANYDFVGWNIYGDQNWNMYRADVTYNTGLASRDGEVVVLYAAWEEKAIHSLAFDGNGGSGVPAMTQAHEDETIRLSTIAPQRDGYTFLGWAETADAVEAQYLPESEFTMGDSVVTLFAVWRRNPSLSFSANGGEFINNVAPVYPAAGSSVTITKIKPIRTGYEFAGWATTDNAETAQYVSGGTFTMLSVDTVLYAVWELQEFTVSRNIAPGYAISGLSDRYCYVDNLEFTVSGVNPKVYINGTLIACDGEGKYTFTVTEQICVIVADSSSLAFIYSANGGSGAPMDGSIYSIGSAATISNIVPVRTGYTFCGWSISKDAQSAEYEPSDSLTFSDTDVILYAVWRANAYTVTYNAAGGEGAMQDSAYSYGTIGALSGNVFVKEGFAFVGWALSEGGVCVFADGDEVLNLSDENGANIALYAVWEQIKTLITFDADGGTGGSANLSVGYGDTLSASGLIAPVRNGYTFGGYFTEKDGNGEMLFDRDMLPVNYTVNGWDRTEQNLTLYAYWIPTPETIMNDVGAAIDEVQSNLDNAIAELQAAINANETDIEAKVSALDSAYKAADTILRSDFTEADAELEAKIAALETAMRAADSALQAAIDTVQSNLDNAIAELQAAINANETDIEAKVSALDSAYKAADTILRSDFTEADAELEAKIAALENAMNAADSALRAGIQELQQRLNEIKAELDIRDDELESKLNLVIAENEKIELTYRIIIIIIATIEAILVVLFVINTIKKKKIN